LRGANSRIEQKAEDCQRLGWLYSIHTSLC
jgi:hypothetical protein